MKDFEECFLDAQTILNLNNDALEKYVAGEKNFKRKQKALYKIERIIKLAKALQME